MSAEKGTKMVIKMLYLSEFTLIVFSIFISCVGVLLLAVSLRELEQRLSALESHRDKIIIMYCCHGIRSARAARLLQKSGFQVHSLMGGLLKRKSERLPLVNYHFVIHYL